MGKERAYSEHRLSFQRGERRDQRVFALFAQSYAWRQARMSEGKDAHLKWVIPHPARARRRARVVRGFISPEAAGAPIYSHWEGRGGEEREEAATMAQIHVTPHRAARSLGEMWNGGCFLLRALSTRFV
jgi:hypothetical protein